MLPIERFTDVVSFLGYHDLGVLMMVNNVLSAVASQCAHTIRLFDFSGFTFYISDSYEESTTSTIDVERLDSGGRKHWVCTLEFASEKEMADFIAEAFQSCTVHRFLLLTTSELVLNAVKAVANAITVADLHVPDELADNVPGLIDVVDSFRQVENLLVSKWEKTLDMRLKNFCRRKKIGLWF